ncbi:glycosyltransferase family 1 protein [Gemmata sp. G18]|uniref:Glycosyltransferase family 1 protein n=1 Tax=Gemmata palustris TaxID=2822762 RepID=A0ABS5BP89_9BACT|nr:glycosyltransferase [Gemmata palustris]MBP3955272.1 glycosyltransferase family 1 protein [Gemmata palustris]
MHVILATVGTDGDVFPHLGLGSVLRERGHRVTLAAPETYRARAEALGLAFASLVTTAEVGRMLAHPDLFHPLRSGRMMARWGAPMIPRQYELLADLAREPGTVLVTNPGLLAGRLVQEKVRCPTASLLLQPGLVPSSTAPPKMTGGLTIPSWFPRPLRELYWLALDVAGYWLVARSLNSVRATLKLAPVRRLFRWWWSPDLVIGLFPNWYAEPQPDWPPQLRLAGFGRFDGTRNDLPDGVRAFCTAGSPPVAFTLGTGMTRARGFFRTAVAACESLGARGLLLTKYPEQLPARLPPTIRHCGFAPFRALLPLCGAVVHHGGIGTTAAALESGCPQLVLPLAWDQPDNAARVARLGVGASLGSRQRTSGHMARALARLVTPAVRARCAEVAAKARGENGLEVAAGWLEEFARAKF